MPKSPTLNTNLSSTYPLVPSTMEDIDKALYDYVDKTLNIFCTTNEGFTKVPLVFSSAERAYQIKEDPNAREYGRTLRYPMMSLVKKSINQNPSNKGRFGTYIPPYFTSGLRPSSIDIARVVNQDKTKNFANADSIRRSSSGEKTSHQTFPGENDAIVYQTLSVPMPAFIEVTYGIDLISNFQQQMNEMLSPFVANHSTPAVFPIFNDKHRYEAFIEPDYSMESNPDGLETDERVFKSTVLMTVLGHIIGADKNQESPTVVVHESATKVRIQRERAIVASDPHFPTRWKDKYRP